MAAWLLSLRILHCVTGEYMAYMMRYDSVHGRFPGEVSGDQVPQESIDFGFPYPVACSLLQFVLLLWLTSILTEGVLLFSGWPSH